MPPSKRRFTPEGLLGHRAGIVKSARVRRAAADARARALAPTIRAIIAEGEVDIPRITDALNRRQIFTRRGVPWTYASTDRLVHTLRRLGLIQSTDKGPYGSIPYSPLPRTRYNTDALRQLTREHADTWALGIRPILQSLTKAGFTKPDAIAEELNKRGIAPQRAELWSYRSVKNLLDRLNEMASRKPPL